MIARPISFVRSSVALMSSCQVRWSARLGVLASVLSKEGNSSPVSIGPRGTKLPSTSWKYDS